MDTKAAPCVSFNPKKVAYALEIIKISMCNSNDLFRTYKVKRIMVYNSSIQLQYLQCTIIENWYLEELQTRLH
jgi:hypothetical protein